MTENDFPLGTVIDWDQLAAAVTQLFDGCVRTRRHSRWGHIVWKQVNGETRTTHVSNCYVRRFDSEASERAVLSGPHLLRAVFGRQRLMDELAERRPDTAKWELFVVDRMSLPTYVDPDPAIFKRHAYLIEDRDGPERGYNNDIVAAGIKFDRLMMQPDKEAGLHISKRAQTAAVEGVSYSVSHAYR